MIRALKFLKHAFLLPGIILYFVYAFFLGVITVLRRKGTKELDQIAGRTAAQSIDIIEWLSALCWMALLVYIFELKYSAWKPWRG